MIYFDNAATTLKKPQEVSQAVLQALGSLGNAGRGAHEAALDAARSIYGVRELLADFFHAEDSSRIAFTSNSTESLNIAIKGSLTAGDHVITTVLEHNSVLRPLYEMEEKGIQITFLPCNSLGMIDYDGFERNLRPNTKAIICTHGSNLTGNLIDIERIGRIARKHALLFMVDASQTAGVFEIDVQKMNIDILCFTGHKSMLGPQGTGGIYVKEGIFLRPLKSGGSGIRTFEKKHPAQMPTALEAGTLNGHGIAGLGAAVSYLKKTGLSVIRQKEQSLMERFYKGICQLESVYVYGDFHSMNRCPIVSFNLGECDSAKLADILYSEYGIATRAGAHCAPLMHQAFGTVNQGAVRFSFSHYNTEKEIDYALNAIQCIQKTIEK